MPWDPNETISKGVVQSARGELIKYLEDSGVHLHLTSTGDVWRIVYQDTRMCHTLRCFKLKLKRFRRDTK